MARGGLVHPLSLFIFVAFAALHMNFGSCFNSTEVLNSTRTELYVWSSAIATWYGDPNGAGSTGGACGYGEDVARPPLSSMIAAGNANLFKSGEGCGSCYQVKCTQNAECSWKPVTVTITDECPGACNSAPIHFDLSGTAFGAMAKYGQANALRTAGLIKIQYMRVPCNYGGTNVVFHVDQGSNPHYFATSVEYENGDGDLSLVELKYANSAQFNPMQHSWGAIWKIDVPDGSHAPFSIRITTLTSRKTLVAKNVIPANWAPGQYYRSIVNFH